MDHKLLFIIWIKTLQIFLSLDPNNNEKIEVDLVLG